MHGNSNIKFTVAVVFCGWPARYNNVCCWFEDDFNLVLVHSQCVYKVLGLIKIIKIICMKEITLLLFSFRHTSLLTVHIDLHGHTASGCLCRSRPLQWCLMYLSRLSACPKSSQRDDPSSEISLLGAKSNQKVLNLANTEGGRAQSLLVGPKTAWRLSLCGTGRCRAKRNQSPEWHMPGLTRRILFRSLYIKHIRVPYNKCNCHCFYNSEMSAVPNINSDRNCKFILPALLFSTLQFSVTYCGINL